MNFLPRSGRQDRANGGKLRKNNFTYDLAGLQPPPPDMQQLFAALRHDQEQTNRFFGIIAGTVQPQEFFAPENIERILGMAAPAAAI